MKKKIARKKKNSAEIFFGEGKNSGVKAHLKMANSAAMVFPLPVGAPSNTLLSEW